MKWSEKPYLQIWMMAVFYTVGIVGISLPEYADRFVTLSAFNLLLTAGLLIWGSPALDNQMIGAIGIAFVIGYWIEVIGVKSGVLFGEYAYGPNLGIKLLDVPLIIGVNWFILAFASYGIMRQLTNNKIAGALGAAALMTGLDVLIEPVAISLDFWSWTAEDVPLQNYLMWFLVSFIVQFIIQRISPQSSFKMSGATFIMQLIFFTVLNITL